MAYNKKVWGSGDFITTEAMNNIEEGVANYNGGADAARIAAGHATFPSPPEVGVTQTMTVNLPAGFFSEVPVVTPVWAARGLNGVVSQVNNPYTVDTTTTHFVVAWLGDGISGAPHAIDWIAVGL